MRLGPFRDLREASVKVLTLKPDENLLLKLIHKRKRMKAIETIEGFRMKIGDSTMVRIEEDFFVGIVATI